MAPLRAAAPGARLSSRNASAFDALHVRPLRHISPAVHVAQICLLFLIAAATAKALRSPSLDDILLALLQRMTARLVTPPLHATYLSLLLMRVQVVNTCGRDAAMTNPPSARAPTVAHCASRLLRSEPRVLRLQPAGLRILPKVRASCANCHVCSVDVQCVRAMKSTQDAPVPKALLVLYFSLNFRFAGSSAWRAATFSTATLCASSRTQTCAPHSLPHSLACTDASASMYFEPVHTLTKFKVRAMRRSRTRTSTPRNGAPCCTSQIQTEPQSVL